MEGAVPTIGQSVELRHLDAGTGVDGHLFGEDVVVFDAEKVVGGPVRSEGIGRPKGRALQIEDLGEGVVAFGVVVGDKGDRHRVAVEGVVIIDDTFAGIEDIVDIP